MDNEVKGLRTLEDVDPIVRILDTAGKLRYEYKAKEERDDLKKRLTESGKQYGISYVVRDDTRSLKVESSFRVARCMVTQKDWYTIFNDLKEHAELRDKLNQILGETSKRSERIDELRRLNSRYRNLLTSKQAISLNAFLFCNDPSQFMSVVSLAHRKLMIDAFGLGKFDESWSYGEQVTKSNELLMRFNEKFGEHLSPRKLSWFLYWEKVQPLWKQEKPEKPPGGVTKHTEVQYRLTKLGQTFECEVWIASNDQGKSFEGEKFANLTVKRLPSFGPKEADRIVELIDVIWFKENTVMAAFEIEMSTSIYSGLLRLSDLVSLAPNIAFPIYIIAPRDRAKDVRDQLLRPTFRLKLKLSEKCKFIALEDLEKMYESLLQIGSVDSIGKIAKKPEQI